MKLTLAEPKFLKESINIIADLVNEARFKITPEGIELIAMDPANVSMVIFKLFSSSFVEYSIKKPQEIGINLNNFKQILRRANPNDIVSIELENDNKLKIVFKSNTIRTFSIPIIELEDKEQKIPDLTFSTVIKTKSSIFNQAIEDADVVAESVTFLAEPAKFTVIGEGDLSKARIEIKQDEDTNIKVTDKAKSRYSIEYLKKMISGAKLADQTVISYSNDYPLKLEYKTVDRVLLQFILAPRVESD